MQTDKEYLFDILDAARLALKYINNKTKEEFLQDVQCQDAVIRRIEIIGEAARKVSKETKSAILLPWGDMVSMRNFMIHDYDDIDLTIVWETVLRDLPQLINTLEKVLETGE